LDYSNIDYQNPIVDVNFINEEHNFLKSLMSNIFYINKVVSKNDRKIIFILMVSKNDKKYLAIFRTKKLDPPLDTLNSPKLSTLYQSNLLLMIL
jgi:hypothetical protein